MLVLAAVACYSQVPLPGPAHAPSPGTPVVAELTDAGTLRLGPALGSGVVRIQGELVEANEDTLVLAVSLVERMSGAEDPWRGETVALPRDYVARLSERRLSTARTAVTAGAFLAGVVSLYLVSEGFAAGGSGRGTPPPTR